MKAEAKQHNAWVAVFVRLGAPPRSTRKRCQEQTSEHQGTNLRLWDVGKDRGRFDKGPMARTTLEVRSSHPAKRDVFDPIVERGCWPRGEKFKACHHASTKKTTAALAAATEVRTETSTIRIVISGPRDWCLPSLCHCYAPSCPPRAGGRRQVRQDRLRPLAGPRPTRGWRNSEPARSPAAPTAAGGSSRRRRRCSSRPTDVDRRPPSRRGTQAAATRCRQRCATCRASCRP